MGAHRLRRVKSGEANHTGAKDQRRSSFHLAIDQTPTAASLSTNYFYRLANYWR